jgi:hypothetical protein
MAADDHLNGQQFFHGSAHPLTPGDLLTVSGAQEVGPRMYAAPITHVHYTSDIGIANRYASGGGQVYAVQPEASNGRRITRHASDPLMPGDEQDRSYRTTGRLRVLHQVSPNDGSPLTAPAASAGDDDDWSQHRATGWTSFRGDDW